MRISDSVIGAGFVVAGAAVFAATLRFPRLEDGAPGPALFPQVLAVLMVLFGAGLALSTLRAPVTVVSPPRQALRRDALLNTLAVFAAIVAFIVLAPKVGFLLTTALMLFALMVRLGTPAWRAALASVALTLFVYVIFGKVLRVPLPLGLVWF